MSNDSSDERIDVDGQAKKDFAEALARLRASVNGGTP